VVFDGTPTTAPVLFIRAAVWVAAASAASPIISYPNPSTIQIRRASARNLVSLKNHYTAGQAYWDFGQTTTYGLSATYPIPDTYTGYLQWN
jgi:hypothetical protein